MTQNLNYGTECYRLKLSPTAANFQIQMVPTLLPRKKGLRIGFCGTQSHGRRGVRSTPIWGEVIKQRIARPGQGRSKGYRVIILFRRGDKAFFEYGFSKNQRSNIDRDEEEQFKRAAKYVLALTEKHLAELLKKGEFVEVTANE